MTRMAPRRWAKAKFAIKAVHPCAYCRCPLTLETATVDHVVPRSRGGTNSPSNYKLACVRCNSKKGANTAPHFVKRAKRRQRRELIARYPEATRPAIGGDDA